MKAAKYAQLLSNATAILTTVNFTNTQLSAFVSTRTALSAELNNKLETMHSSLLLITQSPPPLSKNEFDSLHAIQRELEKISKVLKQDLEKPALDHRKAIEKIEKEINEKILPELNAQSEPCGFDLKFIYKLLEQAKPGLDASKQKLDTCFREIIKSQTKINSVSEQVHALDLPNELEKTSHNIEKITKDLVSLNLQLAAQPSIKEQYHKEFLPLRAALTGLRLQSQALVEEPRQEASATVNGSKPNLRA